MTRFIQRFRSREGTRHSPESIAESDVSMALGAAFLGTLLLGGVVGVESHWELLVLLAIVAAVAFVFEAVALPRDPVRPPLPGSKPSELPPPSRGPQA
jgi:hypothetical protein